MCKINKTLLPSYLLRPVARCRGKFTTIMFFHFINLCMILLFFYIPIFLRHTGTEANPTYLIHVCRNTSTYTSNSTYQSNLNRLLAYLSSNATSSLEFYNASVGYSVDEVYGLYLCRGDLPAEACRDCVAYATKYIVDLCPIQKVVVVWYDECMLRYSNRYIFSTIVPDPTASFSSLQIVSEANRFNELVMATMNDLVMGVSIGRPGAKKFWTKEVNFTALRKLYTLAQCTPDLSGSDCSSCLQQAIPNLPTCCAGREGGRVLFPSCNVGFDLNPFYQSVAVIPSPPGPVKTPKGKDQISSLTIVAVVVPISISVLLFIMGYRFLRRRVRKKYNAVPEENAPNDITNVESLKFDLAMVETATNMFSDDNKLGEGGFGAVYKGKFPNGQMIAVKRLSKSSTQGEGEFKNEIVLIAKLQHRNLVRLLGFCLEGKEKILIYEYMPNKSLDYFLYEPSRKEQLNWSICYKIIEGIARGIQYLYEDCQHRIIHRDLKASNILLDQDMSPKISDFGLAKIFGIDQTQGKASRIVGTRGYISPEYATYGQISVKSDIYSFGVIILEIITGQKINSYQSEGEVHLLSHAWRHLRDGTEFKLLDPTLGDSYSRDEFIRCLHLGLLCVQSDPVDRPSIAAVVLMLNSDSVTLLSPLQPAYFFSSRAQQSMQSDKTKSNQSRSKGLPLSINEVSITELHPR